MPKPPNDLSSEHLHGHENGSIQRQHLGEPGWYRCQTQSGQILWAYGLELFPGFVDPYYPVRALAGFGKTGPHFSKGRLVTQCRGEP